MFSFHKLISYLIIAGIGYGGYYLYNTESEGKESEINFLVLGFYPLFFISVYLGDWGTSYLLTAYLLFLGYTYLQNGLLSRDTFTVILGGSAILNGVMVKFSALPSFILDSQIGLGFLVLLSGVIFLTLLFYMRSKWTVTEEDAENLNTNKPTPIDGIDAELQ